MDYTTISLTPDVLDILGVTSNGTSTVCVRYYTTFEALYNNYTVYFHEDSNVWLCQFQGIFVAFFDKDELISFITDYEADLMAA